MRLADDFELKFTFREVTAWGGLALLKRLLDGLNFKAALQSWPLPQPGSNRGYRPEQLIEQMIVSIWCGAARFDQARATQMQTQSYPWFFDQLRLPSITLDVDSTVLTRWGAQIEGGTKRYNPKHHGRASHHPLLAFVADWRLSPISGCARATPVQPTMRTASSKRRLRTWGIPRSGCFELTVAFTTT